MKLQGIRCKGLDRKVSNESEAIARELAQWCGAAAVFEPRGKHGAVRITAADGSTAYQIIALSASDWRAQANAVCRLRRTLRALGCKKLTTEVEDSEASPEARAYVPKIVKPEPVSGEHDGTKKAAKRAFRGIILDRSKPHWVVLIDDQEAGVFQSWDDVIERQWPPNAYFEPRPEADNRARGCCTRCGSPLRDHVSALEYEEDFFDLKERQAVRASDSPQAATADAQHLRARIESPGRG